MCALLLKPLQSFINYCYIVQKKEKKKTRNKKISHLVHVVQRGFFFTNTVIRTFRTALTKFPDLRFVVFSLKGDKDLHIIVRKTERERSPFSLCIYWVWEKANRLSDTGRNATAEVQSYVWVAKLVFQYQTNWGDNGSPQTPPTPLWKFALLTQTSGIHATKMATC